MLDAATVAANRTGAGGSGDWGDGDVGAGGGVAIQESSVFTVHNSILADNYVDLVPNDCSGTATSKGHNLIADIDECILTAAAGDIVGVAALLLPLGDYGGPTPTHQPGFTSPAVDAGSCETVDGDTLSLDQRGVVRPQAGTCDMGAVEVLPPESVLFMPLMR